jgi:T5SS/PEP-CTERM-associated repeat protein
VLSNSTASFTGSIVPINVKSVIGADGGTGSVIVSGAGSSLTLGGVIVGEDAAGNAGSGTLQVDSGGALFTGSMQMSAGATLNVLSGGTFATNAIDFTTFSRFDIAGASRLSLGQSTLPAAGLTISHTTELDFVHLTGNLTIDGTVNIPTQPNGITGNYTQNSDALLSLGIFGEPPYGYSALDVSGAATWGGTLQVSFSGTFEPVGGETYHILSWGSETGTFSNVELPPLPGFLTWDTSQLYVDGQITVVPEPVTSALFVAAVIGFAARRRRS